MPVHHHIDAHAYLLVMDGRVEMRIGSTVGQVGKHGLGYAPPNTRVGLRNRSDTPVALMLIYNAAGMERAFAAAHERSPDATSAEYQTVLTPYGFRFDDAPLVNDARTNASEPPVRIEFKGGDDLARLRQAFFSRSPVPRMVTTAPEEYEPGDLNQTLRKQLLTGDDSSGTAMMNMVSLVPGPAVDPHHQPTEDEFFFITEGPAELTCGSETRLVDAGTFAYCPRNCTHGFRNPNPDRRMQFVTLNSPAGHERALVALRQAIADGAPPDALTELSIAGGWRNHVPYT